MGEPGFEYREHNSRITYFLNKVNISIFGRDAVIIDIKFIYYSSPEHLLLKIPFVLIPDRKVHFDLYFLKLGFDLGVEVKP